jgi:hypothetical protein
MRDDPRDQKAKPNCAGEKRPYHSPVLTEYGSIEDLVDAGAMGGPVPTVPAVLLIL